MAQPLARPRLPRHRRDLAVIQETAYDVANAVWRRVDRSGDGPVRVSGQPQLLNALNIGVHAPIVSHGFVSMRDFLERRIDFVASLSQERGDPLGDILAHG